MRAHLCSPESEAASDPGQVRPAMDSAEASQPKPMEELRLLRNQGRAPAPNQRAPAGQTQGHPANGMDRRFPSAFCREDNRNIGEKPMDNLELARLLAHLLRQGEKPSTWALVELDGARTATPAQADRAPCKNARRIGTTRKAGFGRIG